jgi:hypothetical protein
MLAPRSSGRNPKVSIKTLFVYLATATTLACSGGSSNPAAPGSDSGSGGSGGSSSTSCRTFTTAADVTTVSGGVTTTAKVTGSFATSNRQSTSNTLFTNGSLCSTTLGNYQSVADFVDEVRVVPPVFLLTSTTTTTSGSCGGTSVTQTYTYDAQRRLTQQSASTGTTTYSAWDSAGRPTTGRSGTSTFTIVYDDAARTQTSTTSGSNGTSTGILTFDANGNQIRNEVRGASGTSVTTYSITSMDKVCK